MDVLASYFNPLVSQLYPAELQNKLRNRIAVPAWWISINSSLPVKAICITSLSSELEVLLA
jgi:uncharacterized PurR-regulated membrane protein YhhQ (DUF165 family)